MRQSSAVTENCLKVIDELLREAKQKRKDNSDADTAPDIKPILFFFNGMSTLVNVFTLRLVPYDQRIKLKLSVGNH